MPLIPGLPRARGFSMLEVLMALAVLSVGLLGAAAMLLDSLRVHGSALHRLGATQLARDMADRIRANPRARALYDTRSAAPVASVFASNATATSPPASRSPMMPLPTTAASSIAVPTPSATRARPIDRSIVSA